MRLRISLYPAFTLDIAIGSYKVQVPAATVGTLRMGCAEQVGDLPGVHVVCVALVDTNLKDEAVAVHRDVLAYL